MLIGWILFVFRFSEGLVSLFRPRSHCDKLKRFFLVVMVICTRGGNWNKKWHAQEILLRAGLSIFFIALLHWNICMSAYSSSWTFSPLLLLAPWRGLTSWKLFSCSFVGQMRSVELSNYFEVPRMSFCKVPAGLGAAQKRLLRRNLSRHLMKPKMPGKETWTSSW